MRKAIIFAKKKNENSKRKFQIFGAAQFSASKPLRLNQRKKISLNLLSITTTGGKFNFSLNNFTKDNRKTFATIR